MPRFEELLRHVFERKGYAVGAGRPVIGASGTTYEAPIFAQHASGDLIVLWKVHGAVSAEDLEAVGRAVSDTNVAGAVVATASAANASPAPGSKVDLWSLPRLIAEVGEAYVHAAVQEEGPAPDGAASGAAAPAPEPVAAPARDKNKFRSLVAMATDVSATAGTDPNVYLYNTKPRSRTSDAASAKPLPYAWSGQGAANAAPTHSSVAEYVQTRRRPAAAAPRAPIMAPEDNDVEIITTPRKRAAPAEPPAPASMVADEEEEYEIITSKKPRKQAVLEDTPAAAPAPASAPAPAPAAAVVAARAPEPPAPAAPEWQGPTAPPQTCAVRLTREQAARAAAAHVGAARDVRLALVPHIAFDYDASVEHPKLSSPLAGRGAVYVNAVTGAMRDGDAVAFGTSLPEAADPPAPTRLQAADVYEKVKGFLTKQFSRELKVTREVGGNEVYENVRVTPALHQLGLDHRGVVNAPVWVVQGERGTAHVDAVTGALIDA